MIDLVLSTDMKQHLALTSHFSTLHRLGPYTRRQQPGDSLPQPQMQQPGLRQAGGSSHNAAGSKGLSSRLLSKRRGTPSGGLIVVRAVLQRSASRTGGLSLALL